MSPLNGLDCYVPLNRPGMVFRDTSFEFVVGSLPCSERFFLRVFRFSPLLKNQHFQISIRSGTHGHVSVSSYELFSAPWVNKLTNKFTILRLELLTRKSCFK